MNQEAPHTDRLEAPSASRINASNSLLGALIAALILAFAYISLSMGSEAASPVQQSFQPQLHTESDRFKMPVFEKPVLKKPEPIIEASIAPEPEIPAIQETPVLPLSLPKIEAVEPVQLTNPEAPKIDPDVARRLGGSISGGSDLGLSTVNSSNNDLTKKADIINTHDTHSNSRAGGKHFSDSPYSSINSRTIKPQTSARPVKEHSNIDLSSSVTHASLATRLENLQFIIKKGTFINCVLTTNIQSDQAGFIKCTVTEDIYSADGTLVLIDRGSEILGEYKPESLSIAKARLHAVWDEVTTPTGVRVSLRSPSVDRLGATGLTGEIDNHWSQRLGVPILLSLFRSNMDYQLARQSRHAKHGGIDYTESGDVATSRIEKHYQQYEKIRPTLRKQAGSTIGIILARDVSFESVYKVMQR